MFWVSLVLLLFPPFAFYRAITKSLGEAGDGLAPLVTAIVVFVFQGMLLAIGGWLAVTLAVVVFLAALGTLAPNRVEARENDIAPAPLLSPRASPAEPPTAAPLDEPDGSPPAYLAEIEFDYVDARGNKSHREVGVDAVDAEYFEGFCFTALATRTFVIGRVRGKILDKETGELLPAKQWAAQARRDPRNGEVSMGGEWKHDDEEDEEEGGIADAAEEILFTGFPKAQRAELEELAELRGMKVVKSVTTGLAYLCTGPKAGPAKIDQAIDVGAGIIDLSDFLALSGE